jgi:hypothetical protein
VTVRNVKVRSVKAGSARVRPGFTEYYSGHTGVLFTIINSSPGEERRTQRAMASFFANFSEMLNEPENHER